MILRRFFAVASALVSVATASAQVIDFETLPDGHTPIPGMAISNQFAATIGVSFEMLNTGSGLANGAYPRLAKVNDDSFVAFISSLPNRVLF